MPRKARGRLLSGGPLLAVCDVTGCTRVVDSTKLLHFPPMSRMQDRVRWWNALFGRVKFQLTARSAVKTSVCPRHFTAPDAEFPIPNLFLPARTTPVQPIPTELVREQASTGSVRTYSRRAAASAVAVASPSPSAGTGPPVRYKAIAPAAPIPPRPIRRWSTSGGTMVAGAPAPAPPAVISQLVASAQQQQQYRIVTAGQPAVAPAPPSFRVMPTGSSGGSNSNSSAGGVIQLVPSSGSGSGAMQLVSAPASGGGGGAMQLVPASGGQLVLMPGQQPVQQVSGLSSSVPLVVVNSNGQPAPAPPPPQQRLPLPRLPLPRLLPRRAPVEQRRPRRRQSSLTISSVQSESRPADAEEDEDAVEVVDVAFGLPESAGAARTKVEVIDLPADDCREGDVSVGEAPLRTASDAEPTPDRSPGEWDGGAVPTAATAVKREPTAADSPNLGAAVAVKRELSDDDDDPLPPQPVVKLEEPGGTITTGPSIIRLKPLSELTAAAARRAGSPPPPPRVPTPPGISLGAGGKPLSEAELVLLSMTARQQQQQQQPQPPPLPLPSPPPPPPPPPPEQQQRQPTPGQQQRQPTPDQRQLQQKRPRPESRPPQQQPPSKRPCTEGDVPPPPAPTSSLRLARCGSPSASSTSLAAAASAAPTNGPMAPADDRDKRSPLEMARGCVDASRGQWRQRGLLAAGRRQERHLGQALEATLDETLLGAWKTVGQTLRACGHRETLVGLINYFVVTEGLAVQQARRSSPQPDPEDPTETSDRQPAEQDGMGNGKERATESPIIIVEEEEQQQQKPAETSQEDLQGFSLPAGLSITPLTTQQHTQSLSDGGASGRAEATTADNGAVSIIPVSRPTPPVAAAAKPGGSAAPSAITWLDRKRCVRLVRCFLCSAGGFPSWLAVHQHMEHYHRERNVLFPETAAVSAGSLVVCALCPEVTPTASDSLRHATERHTLQGADSSTVPARLRCPLCRETVGNVSECVVLHAVKCSGRDGAGRPDHLTCEPCDVQLRDEDEVQRHLEEHSQGRLGVQSRCQLCDFSGFFSSCQRHVQSVHRERCWLLGCALCPQFSTDNWTLTERHIYRYHRVAPAPEPQRCPTCRLLLVGDTTILSQHMQLHRSNKVVTTVPPPGAGRRRPGPRCRTRGRPAPPPARQRSDSRSESDPESKSEDEDDLKPPPCPSPDDLSPQSPSRGDAKLNMVARVSLLRLESSGVV